MKKIIQPEIFELLDDSTCPATKVKWGPDVEINFHFGYGSNRDGDYNTFHFSSAAAEELWIYLKQKYPHLVLKNHFD